MSNDLSQYICCDFPKILITSQLTTDHSGKNTNFNEFKKTKQNKEKTKQKQKQTNKKPRKSVKK